MAQIISPHIWYPAGYPGPAYDLRKTIHWSCDSFSPTRTRVRFLGDPVAVVSLDTAAFEAAKQASLDAE